MRFICDARRDVRTRDLLRMSGMLSIRQLVVFRVLITGLLAKWRKQPDEISKWTDPVNRRLRTTERSFHYMFGTLLDRIPDDLKDGDPNEKKMLLKQWVRENVPHDHKWNNPDPEGLDPDESGGY